MSMSTDNSTFNVKRRMNHLNSVPPSNYCARPLLTVPVKGEWELGVMLVRSVGRYNCICVVGVIFGGKVSGN